MDSVSGSLIRALVTGASSGIGTAFAERLAAEGYDLIVVARRRDRLDALADQLRREHKVAVEVLAADLTDSADLRTVERRAAEASLSLLVNNAGFAGYMPFIRLDPGTAEDLVRVHVTAITRLTRAVLPGMVARGRGAVVNVASLLGFSSSMPSSSPLPKRAVYAGCKAYIIAFSEALHHEVADSGVQVQALCPGVVGETELHDSVPGFDASRLAGVHLKPADVVQASLAGLQLGEAICIPGLEEPAAVDRVRADQRELLTESARAPLAGRYRGGSNTD